MCHHAGGLAEGTSCPRALGLWHLGEMEPGRGSRHSQSSWWPWEGTGPGRARQLEPVTHGDEEVARKGRQLRRDRAGQKNPLGDGEGAAWPPGLRVPVQADGTSPQDGQHRQGWAGAAAGQPEGGSWCQLQSPVPLTW